jgi:nonsense-mediated mRNA decay protein 3
MLCVECGKKEVYKDGSCIECYLKKHKFTEGPEIIDLPVCSHCQAYKYKNTWTSELLNDVLRRIIKKHFKIKPELKKIDINLDCLEVPHGYECKVYISGFIGETELTEEHDLTVRLKKTVCETCSKQFGGYHEAIIQIRTEKRKLTKNELFDIRKTVETQVENLRGKGNRTLFISDMGEEHGGLNFFLSDKNAAFVISKILLDKFGGILKQSSSNIGMKDGRQQYRNTYLVRIPSFRKNDFIDFMNKYYLVKGVHSNNVKLKNLSNWEETTLDFKNLENAKILGGKELLKEMIIVSQTKNDIQVMNEKTYMIKTLKKPIAKDYKSEKIKTVKIDEQIYIFPE